jgi:hypothetical protein
MTREGAMERRKVDCPRCNEQCGWCSDPRWMHGTLRLPGSRRKCKVPGYEPEGAACPMCHGEKLVLRTVTYAPLSCGEHQERTEP